MKRKIWVTSDLYLGQKSRRALEKRLLKMWSHVVRPDDTVLLLGNVSADKVGYWFNVISGLPGRKRLMLGSDDRYRTTWYKKWDFEDVVPFHRALLLDSPHGQIMFTHLPAFRTVIHNDKFANITENFAHLYQSRSCILNIHGHTRGKGHRDHRAFDASIEATDEQLLTLDQILERAWK